MPSARSKTSKLPKWAPSAVALGRILGVTRQTIHRWLKEEGNPGKKSDGRFEVSKWKAFATDRAAQVVEDAKPTVRQELENRKLRAAAEAAEMRTATMRRELIAKPLVDAEILRLVGEASSVLRSKFADELPPRLAGASEESIRAACSAAVEEVCLRLSRGLNLPEAAPVPAAE